MRVSGCECVDLGVTGDLCMSVSLCDYGPMLTMGMCMSVSMGLCAIMGLCMSMSLCTCGTAWACVSLCLDECGPGGRCLGEVCPLISHDTRKGKVQAGMSQLVELSCSGYWETGISTLTGSS